MDGENATMYDNPARTNQTMTHDNQTRHIACYLTNHGFGHVNRLLAVLNEIDAGCNITVRCDEEIWPALTERLKRPVAFGYFPCDNGTASPPGQNSQTDWPATFERLETRFELISTALENEIDWLRTAGVSAVYADSSPLPLRAAELAGVPGFLGANFCWHEIFDDLLHAGPAQCFSAEQRGRYESIIRQLQSACRSATLLQFWPHTPMLGVGREKREMGLVVNSATDIRPMLLDRFQLSPSTKLVYFYVGRYGVEELPWEKLTQFPENVVFIGLHPPGRELPGRFFTIEPKEFSGADLLKSCDVAVVKAGYGAVAEAMAAGTPVIYPPREGFVEFPYLDAALRNWSGGFPVSEFDFSQLNLIDVLNKAIAGGRADRPNVAVNGAAQVARIIESRVGGTHHGGTWAN